MQDAPIVSHVASPEYRANVDAMTCAEPGCKRWRLDDMSKFCPGHKPIKVEGIKAIAERARSEAKERG